MNKSTPLKKEPFDENPGNLVSYEQNQSTVLGIIKGKNGKKISVINETKASVHLNDSRLFLLKKNYISPDNSLDSISKKLLSLKEKASSNVSSNIIEELWEFTHSDNSELSTFDLAESYFGEFQVYELVGLRFQLTTDQIFFKRTKGGFIPRTPEVVEELKVAAQKKADKVNRARDFLKIIDSCILSNEINIDSLIQYNYEIQLLGDLASNSQFLNGQREKEAKTLIKKVKEFLGPKWGKLKIPDMIAEKDEAFAILFNMGILKTHEPLSLIRNRPTHDITSKKCSPYWNIINNNKSIIENENSIEKNGITTSESPKRELYIESECFTIDDETTQDMDDALSFTQTQDGYEVGIHITDLTDQILKGSRLDEVALERGTSIYIPGMTLNMLPNSVVRNFSLEPNKERECLSLFCKLSHNFEVKDWTFRRTIIKSSRKYSYNEVDDLLDDHNPPFNLLELSKFSAYLEAKRSEAGALFIQRREVNFYTTERFNQQPKINSNDHETPARKLVAEMMILYNSLFAKFAWDNNIPVIFRSQEDADSEKIENAMNLPEGPARDFAIRTSLKPSKISFTPARHSSLGLECYAQSSSPIRRYYDLVCQRQVTSFLKGEPLPLTEECLTNLMNTNSSPLGVASSINKETKRYWLLEYLNGLSKSGTEIGATVLRNDPPMNRGQSRRGIVELDEIHYTLPVRDLDSSNTPGSRIRVRIVTAHARSDYLKLKVV